MAAADLVKVFIGSHVAVEDARPYVVPMHVMARNGRGKLDLGDKA